MSEETNELQPIETPSVTVYQGDWRIEKYCKLRALNRPRRESYLTAFEIPKDAINEKTLDTRIDRLEEKHPEIPSLIAHESGVLSEEWDAKWWTRRREAAEKWWFIFLLFVDNPKTMMLAAKAFEIVCMLLGWKAPEKVEVKATGGINTSQVESKIDRLMLKLGVSTTTPNTQGENHA